MEQLGKKSLHEGKHVDFVAGRYRRADGTEVEREVVEHPGSVAVPAHDDETIEIVRLDLAEIDQVLPQIRDATTVIALQHLQATRR